MGKGLSVLLKVLRFKGWMWYLRLVVVSCGLDLMNILSWFGVIVIGLLWCRMYLSLISVLLNKLVVWVLSVGILVMWKV